MKIKIIWREDDFRGRIEQMEVDGKHCASVGGGEPEDNRIGRDLISCCEIADLMEYAHAAGAAGEPSELEVVKEKNG